MAGLSFSVVYLIQALQGVRLEGTTGTWNQYGPTEIVTSGTFGISTEGQAIYSLVTLGGQE